MEAVPVYQTSLMIMWIVTGLVVLNESQFYEGSDLLGIFGSILLCCIGIKLLTMKRQLMKSVEAARQRENSIASVSSRSKVEDVGSSKFAPSCSARSLGAINE